MTTPASKRSGRHLLWFGVSLALPIPWVVADTWGGLGLPAMAVAMLAGGLRSVASR